jgi:plastocyanin
MRRTLPSVAGALAATALLAACGSDDTSSDHMGNTSMTNHMGGDSMGGDSIGDHRAPSPVMPGARRIEVTAESLAFDPDEITVSAGEDIAVVLTAEDLLHDFAVDELDAHVTAAGGATEEGGLRADKPGRYTFYCSVPGHREAGMEGTLIVT